VTDPVLLTASERGLLLSLARISVAEQLGLAVSTQERVESAELTGGVMASRGVFVTLRQVATEPAGAAPLRGCIGTLDDRVPLYRNVIATAPKAALEDPRFPPLSRDELASTRIEISALTLKRPLDRIDSLELGRDGVELEQGSHHAVFLPQVATEQGWKVEELLRNLSAKAGLAPDGWRGASLSVFGAEVFKEGES